MTYETQSDADLAAPDGYEACPACWTVTIPDLDGGTGGMTDADCQCLSRCVPENPCLTFCPCAHAMRWSFTMPDDSVVFAGEQDVVLRPTPAPAGNPAFVCSWTAMSQQTWQCLSAGPGFNNGFQSMERWFATLGMQKLADGRYSVLLSISVRYGELSGGVSICHTGPLLVAEYMGVVSHPPCDGTTLVMESVYVRPPEPTFAVFWAEGRWCTDEPGVAWPANCGFPATLNLVPSGATCGDDPTYGYICDFQLCHDPCASKGGVIAWRTDNETGPSLSGPACGRRYNDRFCRKWNLLYDTAEQTWTLRSFSGVDHPIYTLHDENPCEGDTKTLSLMPSDGIGGCEQAPRVVTITRGTDCESCGESTEEGCHVSLYRHCGETSYRLKTATLLSAVFDDNPPDAATDDPPTTMFSCCGVLHGYVDADVGCPTSAQAFHGYADPWKYPPDIHPYTIWDLDIEADPAVLTGTFEQGTVTYTADTDLKCDGVTHFTKTATTLSDELSRKFPTTCCVAPDNFVTCNVRVGDATSPQNCAGYDADTGQDDFCACEDTCEASLSGSMKLSNDGGICKTESVCFTRQDAIAPRDGAAKTIYPRIGCMTVSDGEKLNVLSMVTYCVGPLRWAADWYCYTGEIGGTERETRSCEYYVTNGTFLATTYADKRACDPSFEYPFPADVETDCVCVSGPPPPPVETDCCPDDPVPATLYLTITDSDCADLIGETATLVYDVGSATWIGDGSNCMGTFVLECDGAQWDLNDAGAPPSSVTCSPLEMTWLNLAGALNSIIKPGCCLPAGNAATIEIVITA